MPHDYEHLAPVRLTHWALDARQLLREIDEALLLTQPYQARAFELLARWDELSLAAHELDQGDELDGPGDRSETDRPAPG